MKKKWYCFEIILKIYLLVLNSFRNRFFKTRCCLAFTYFLNDKKLKVCLVVVFYFLKQKTLKTCLGKMVLFGNCSKK